MTTFLANLTLIFHFLYVLGVIVPAFLIPVGWMREWSWVRSKRFRMLHAGMMGFVLFEVLVGMACPLTVLENQLLTDAGRPGYQDDFITFWVSKLMYWQMPYWAFVAIYVAFFSLIIFLWSKYPPSRRT